MGLINIATFALKKDDDFRQGKLITFQEWAKMFQDDKIKRVALTEIRWGATVSTVWLGLNHNLGFAGPPLIFGSMVFRPNSYDSLDIRHYSTETQAIDGHAELVKQWQNSPQ